MKEDISEILFTEEQIRQKVKEMGAAISRDYAGKPLTVLAVLRGAVIFCSDLIRSMDIPIELNFATSSTYKNGTTPQAKAEISAMQGLNLKGRHVLIVEDIVDTGSTMLEMRKFLLSMGTESVKICALLDKPSRRKVDISADYAGFTVDDVFVVGYGLDYAEKYRNLPYIGYLKPSVYEK